MASFREVEGAALTILDLNHSRHWGQVGTQVFQTLWVGWSYSRWTGRDGGYLYALCLCLCVRVRGMGSCLEGNGITSCPHCISTCQPAEAKEHSDSLWRLASTPTLADARHTCMNTHTAWKKTSLSGCMLCCTKAYKYAINDSYTCHAPTWIWNLLLKICTY